MKSRRKRYAVYFVIIALVALMLIFSQKKADNEVTKGNTLEENADTAGGSGFLEIETSPKDAEVFIDGANKGKSPIIIGNVAAGVHDVTIKKEGYEDFLKQVEVNPGKRAFLEAKLIIISQKEPIQVPFAEEPQKEKENDQIKEKPWEESSNSGKVNLGSVFLLYYDFGSREFKSTRPEDYDVFSKRYKDHLTFTRANPAQMKAINKDIADVRKEDCEGINGQYGQLASGQSLCAITKEGQIAAIGGSWENTENAELKWKVFD